MPEPLLVAITVALVGLLVLAPLRRRDDGGGGAAGDRLDSARARYRIALEALRDVEADRRAGALEDAAYRVELAAAEERAVGARADLGAEPMPAADLTLPASAGRASHARRASLAVAALIGVALIVASVVPPPIGLAGETTLDRQLAAEQAAEEARQERIGELLERLSADPSDRAALSELADAYLAGSSGDDLARAASALLVLIGTDSHDADAHRRIVAAYLRAGDYVNAAAALAALEALDPDPADVAFFRGLLALRGDGDAAAAEREFDRFLELAPDDDRAPMVRALRTEAARQAGG